MKINSSDTRYGSAVKITCEGGYSIQGQSTLVCLNNGTWSSPLPACVASVYQCPSLTLGEHMKTNSSDTSYGSAVNFACTDGYTLQGRAILVCLNNGTWSSLLPACVAPVHQCPLLTLGEHMKKNSSDTSYGSVVKFTCTEGYKMTGQPILVCQNNGTWNSPIPSCVATDQCPALTLGQHMKANSSDTSYGSAVKLNCTKDYKIKGQDVLVCQKNGSWIPGIPACVDITPASNGLTGGNGEGWLHVHLHA